MRDSYFGGDTVQDTLYRAQVDFAGTSNTTI